jgi:hypothetical protein
MVFPVMASELEKIEEFYELEGENAGSEFGEEPDGYVLEPSSSIVPENCANLQFHW